MAHTVLHANTFGTKILCWCPISWAELQCNRLCSIGWFSAPVNPAQIGPTLKEYSHSDTSSKRIHPNRPVTAKYTTISDTSSNFHRWLLGCLVLNVYYTELSIVDSSTVAVFDLGPKSWGRIRVQSIVIVACLTAAFYIKWYVVKAKGFLWELNMFTYSTKYHKLSPCFLGTIELSYLL